MRGGRREGAGRKKGSNGEKSVARARKVSEAMEAVEAALPDAFAGDAHTLLVSIYKDPRQPWPFRLEAAKTAIGYEKPKLAAIEHSGDPERPVDTVVRIELVAPDGSVVDQSYPSDSLDRTLDKG